MYRSVVEEEQNNKQSTLSNNLSVNNTIKVEENNINIVNTSNNQSLIEVNNEKKVNNPFVKSSKEDLSKQKNIFEDLSKSTGSQNNIVLKNQGDVNISQKIGFKRKTNNGDDEKNMKIENQLQSTKIKK